MQTGDLKDLIDVYVFPTGRRLRVFERTLARVVTALAVLGAAGGELTAEEEEAGDASARAALAEAIEALDDEGRAALAEGLVTLRGHLGEAIEHDGETFEVEHRWARQRARAADDLDQTPGALDRVVDEALSVIHSVAGAFTRVGGEQGAAAARVLDACFPLGLGAVVHQAHDLQIDDNRRIIHLTRGELAADIERLVLGETVERLAEANKRFARVLGTGEPMLTFDEVKARQAQGQQRLLESLALILGACWRARGPLASVRDALLAPVIEQSVKVRERRRNRRRLTDINPTTGEAIDEEGQPIDDADEPADEG